MAKKLRLIPNWHRVILRLWSVRISLALAAVSGVYSIWGAFQEVLPLWLFAVLAVGMSIAITLARITKQPGIE